MTHAQCWDCMSVGLVHEDFRPLMPMGMWVVRRGCITCIAVSEYKYSVLTRKNAI